MAFYLKTQNGLTEAYRLLAARRSFPNFPRLPGMVEFLEVRGDALSVRFSQTFRNYWRPQFLLRQASDSRLSVSVGLERTAAIFTGSLFLLIVVAGALGVSSGRPALEIAIEVLFFASIPCSAFALSYKANRASLMDILKG
jgi:hypothetical protein